MKLSMWLLVLSLLASCAGSPKIAAPSAAVADERPLAAIALTSCGKAIAMFVFTDPTHMLRSDARQSDVFTAKPDGTGASQTTGESLPWEKMYEFALKAPIQTNAVVPCQDNSI